MLPYFDTTSFVVTAMIVGNHFHFIGEGKETAGGTPCFRGVPLKYIILDLGDTNFIWLD